MPLGRYTISVRRYAAGDWRWMLVDPEGNLVARALHGFLTWSGGCLGADAEWHKIRAVSVHFPTIDNPDSKGKWVFKIEPKDDGWIWQLYDTYGRAVKPSDENYATQGLAVAGALSEKQKLRLTKLDK